MSGMNDLSIIFFFQNSIIPLTGWLNYNVYQLSMTFLKVQTQTSLATIKEMKQLAHI